MNTMAHFSFSIKRTVATTTPVIIPSFKSFNFNGASYANTSTIGYYGSAQLPAGGTAECWIKVPTTNISPANNYQGIIVKNAFWGIYIKANYLSVYNWGSTGTADNTYSGKLMNDGLWHHIALVFSPSVTNGSKIFLDGSMVLQFTMSYPASTDTNMFSIGSSAGVQQYFNGQISYLRIWNTLKSDSFISSNYKNFLVPASYSDLIGSYYFQEGTGTTITNSSNVSPYNTYNLTLTGTNVTSWSMDAPINFYTMTVTQPSYLVFNYKFNPGDISGTRLANYASGTAVYDASVNGGATIDNTIGNVAFGAGSLKLVATSSQFVTFPTFTINLIGFTISLWCKGTVASPNLGSIFQFNNTSGSQVDLIAMNYHDFYIFTTAGLQNNVPITTTNNGLWNHYVWTLDYTVTTSSINYGNWNVYINGAKYSTNLGLYYPANIARTFNIFGKHQNNSDYNTGNHDEIRIYNRSLSATEAKNLYYFNDTSLSFNSITFNGSQNGILSDATYYNDSGNTGLTIEVWFKIPTTNTNTDYQGIVVKQSQYGIFMLNSKLMAYNWGNNSHYSTNITINDGLWHHAAITFKSGTTTNYLYLDGNIVNVYLNGAGSPLTSFPLTYSSNTVPLVIGCGSASSTQFLTGSVAFVRIWNTLKTATQISEIYNDYIDPALYSDLIGFYSFNEGSGVTVNNNTSNNKYNFTLSGSPTWSSNDIPTIIRNAGLLTSIPTGCKGLYACKWVNTNYTGPILKLRKSSDTTGTSPQNFYMDKTGKVITTAPNGRGTSFATWLGADTAYVDTWYDQSLGARDATMNTFASGATSSSFLTYQPIFEASTPCIIFNSTFLNLPNNILSTGNTPYSITYKIKNAPSYGTSAKYLISYGDITLNNSIQTAFTDTIFYNNINGFGGSTYSKYRATDDVITAYYNKSNLNMYINGILGTSFAATVLNITQNNAINQRTNALGGIVTPTNSSVYSTYSSLNMIDQKISYITFTETSSYSSNMLDDSNRQLMEGIDDIIINGKFFDSITGTSQIVYNETPVIGWTLSAVDNTFVKFLIAKTSDTIYTCGTSTTYPFLQLPSSIPQFLVSRLSNAGYSQTITQSVNISSAGIYTLSFYHSGRAGTNLYTTNHTLTVTFGSTTIVSNLSTSITGWQLYTGGLITILNSDIGTKNLTFTFSNSQSLDSSYYISGITLNYSTLALYSSIPTGSVGLFSCKWVNNNYMGPILKLRKSSQIDNTNATDFYMDRTGMVITTGTYGTGTTLASWLGIDTAYVVTWYDQSLQSNHATQSIINYQPTLVLFNGLYTVYFYKGGADPIYLGLTKAPFSTGNNSFTIISKLADTTSIPSSGYKMFFSTGSNANYQIQQAFNNRIIQHAWYGGNGATYTPTWSNNLLISCDYNSASTYSKRIYLSSSSNAVATLASGTALSLLYNTSTPDIFGSIGAYGGQYLASTTTIDKQYCLTGSLSHLSLYNTLLSTTDRQKMEQIDLIVYNGNFSQSITGTLLYPTTSGQINNWTQNTIGTSQAYFGLVTTSETGYTVGTSTTSPYVALPSGVTQFLMSKIIANSSSHNIKQTVIIPTAGVYILTFYYAGRPNNIYSTTHTLKVDLASKNIVTGLQATTSATVSAVGWQLYTAFVTLTSDDVGAEDLTFTFSTGTATDSSYYITGINLNLSTSSNNTIAINNLISGVTPWGIYDASLWNSITNVLPEARGLTAKNVTKSGAGTITYSTGSGNGATASVPQIAGGTTSILTWPTGSWPTAFTICGIVRYTSTTVASRKRLFTSTTANNHLLGSFDNTYYVYAVWESVARSSYQSNTTSTDWIVCCGKNTPNTTAGTALNTVLMNGVAVGTTTGGNGGGLITLNGYPTNESEWAFSYLVIYDSVLTDSQMATVSAKLQNYLYTGSVADTSIPRAIYSSVPTGTSGLYSCRWVNNNYIGPILKLRKSSDATGTNATNFYIDNTGMVITTNPNGTGTTFSTWLGVDTAYVNVWYDQSVTGSSGGKDATQTFTESQPVFTLTNGIDLSGTRFLVLPNTLLTTGGTTYTMSYKIKNTTNINNNGAVFMYGQHTANELVLFFSGGTPPNSIYNGRWGQTYAQYAFGTIPNNLVVTNKYGSNVLTLYSNGVSVATASSTHTIANGTSVTTATTGSGSGESNTIGTGRNETFIQNFGGSLKFLTINSTSLSDSDRVKLESNDDNVINGNFNITITSTYQGVNNYTPFIGWTLSTVDNINTTFLIATTSDTIYARGTSVTAPFVALPATITQYLVSQIVTAGYSQSISQPITIISAGTYTLSFYYTGRSTASSYATNHTLTVSLGSTTLVTNLSASTSGWQLYTGSVTITNGDVGTKNLNFIFYNGQTLNSSYYITGVNVVYSSNLNSINTNTINNLIPGVTPWGIYDASLWNATTKTLPEARGNGRDASGNGTFTYNSAISGNGAIANVPQLSGTTAETMLWPAGSVPNTYTFCSITRWTDTNTANQNGILTNFVTGGTAGTNLIVHGQWLINSKVGHYNGSWINTYSLTESATSTNWFNVCARNTSVGTTAYNVLINNVTKGTGTAPLLAFTAGSDITKLCINKQTNITNTSNWAFTYLIIYDTVLTDAQMATVSNKLQNYLATGSMVDSYSNISRGIYPSVPNGSVGLYACKWVNNLYKGPILKLRKSSQTDNTGATNFYIDNTGTVNTTGPGGTGTTLTSWLGSDLSAYVNVWYDQSGQGKDASQNTIAYQPFFDYKNKRLDFTNYVGRTLNSSGLYFNLPDGTVPTGDSPYTFCFKHNSLPTNPPAEYAEVGLVFSAGNSTTHNYVRLNGTEIWNPSSTSYYNKMNVGFSGGAVASITYDNNSSARQLKLFINGSNTTTLIPAIARTTPSTNNKLGNGADVSQPYPLNVPIYHLSLFNTLLTTNDRQLMEAIDDTIINNNFVQPISGTSQLVSNETPVYGWTLSAIDIINSAFLIATTSDTTYARGTSTASPFLALPTTITQFLVSQIINAGYSHTITQSVNIATAGSYTLSFYHAGRSTASSYSTNHTLTVTFGSTTMVTALQTSATGWQQYVGYITLTGSDIGTKNLTFTFTNSTTTNSSYYVTGVNINIYTKNDNTDIINNLIPGVTPWGIYDASLWNSNTKTLPEARGFNAKNAIGSGAGTFTYNSAISGNGATASVPQLSGGTTSILTWPDGSIPINFTICGISRYTGSTNVQRTFAATNKDTIYNFLLGYWAGKAGVAYWGGVGANRDFRTNSAGLSPQPTLTNWLVSCGKSDPTTTVNSVLMNGKAVGTASAITGSPGSSGTLTINGFLNPSLSEQSDWAFTYLVIYDRVLTDTQMATVSAKLQNYLIYGTMANSYSNISRGIYPSVPTGSVGLYACKWVNNLYKGPILKLRKSSDTTGASSQNFYIDKTGTVITTLPDGSGTTFASWLTPDSRAYVNIWYDQSVTGSSGGKDASQNSVTYQPIFDITNGVHFYNSISPTTSNNLNLPQGILGSTATPSYSISFLIKDSINIENNSNLKPVLFLSGNHSASYKDVELYVSKPISGTNGFILNAFYGDGNCSYSIPYTSNNQLDNTVISCTYESTNTTRNIFLNKSTTAIATIATGTLAYDYTSGTQINSLGMPNTLSTIYDGKFGGSLKFFSILNNTTQSSRTLMESIDDTIINNNFSQTIPGTSQFVSNETPVIGWTLSAIDFINSSFFIATTSDTTYARGTSTTSPFVALPTTITQFLVSQIINAGYSQTITQSINITSEGSYTLSFYHAGRSTASSYSTTHTLTVTFGSTTMVTALQTSATGWQQYVGYITITGSDIGTKNLTFTFTNSTTSNSSYYVTGVNIAQTVFSDILNGDFSLISPQPATNSYTLNPTITNWTRTGSNSYGCNGTGPFDCTSLPSTQYIAFQSLTAGSTVFITQTLTLPAGTYKLSFYSWPRKGDGSSNIYYNISQSLSVYIGTTNLTPTPITYISPGLTTTTTATLQTIQFTITTGGSYDLKFSSTNTASNDSSIGLAKISLNSTNNNTSIINTLISGVTPWGIYDASLWNATTKTLPEARGITARDASGNASGTFTYNSAISGNGATVSIPSLSGITSSILKWPSGSIPTNFTICAITRYTNNSGNQQRILTSYGLSTETGTSNWVLGHINLSGSSNSSGNSVSTAGLRGQAYFQTWKTDASTSYGTKTNWLVTCGKNGTNGTAVNSVLADGTAIGGAQGGSSSSNGILGINNYGGNIQQSDWALTYLVIYDTVLTDTQMASVSTRLQSYLTTGYMVEPPIVTASGTVVTSGNTYIFTGNGSMTLKNVNVRILAVGGGGGGAWGNAPTGGGGGGGVVELTLSITTQSVLTITIGTGGTSTNSPGSAGSSGTNTTCVFTNGYSSITAGGGGSGGANGSSSGGSGGGAGRVGLSTAGGTKNNSNSNYANNGGKSSSIQAWAAAGGGGGAGGVGGDGTANGTIVGEIGGNGGIGYLSDITGQSLYWAGGGGAGNQETTSTPGKGGLGGGGAGLARTNYLSSNNGLSGYTVGSNGNAGVNTGGGGGGAQATGFGTGGSGIFIVKILY